MKSFCKIFAIQGDLHFLLKIFILFFILKYPIPINSRQAKLTLVYNSTENSIDSKHCPAGILAASPTAYTCACITGVWGLYHEYCGEPISIIGGESFCAPLPPIPGIAISNLITIGKSDSVYQLCQVAQTMIFGNPRAVFQPSLSHFTGQFSRMTSFYTDDDDTIGLDGESTFLSITDNPWTIYGDTGTSICLKATMKGNREFCMFGNELAQAHLRLNWTLIVKIRKGCFGTLTYYADKCSVIHPPNNASACGGKWNETVVGRHCTNSNCTTTTTPAPSTTTTTELTTTSTERTTPDPWLKLPGSGRKSTTTVEPWWIPLPHKNNRTTDITTTTTTEDSTWWIPLPKRPTKMTTSTTTESTSTSTTTEAPLDDCSGGITRAGVKRYWHSSSNSPCPKSLTQAVFTDQLRRFATAQMDKVLPSRLRSLEQLEKLMALTLKIMQTTCPDEIVSAEFLKVTMTAFLIFVKEDFFYGMNEATKEGFDRIEADLEMCLATATPFAFETTELDCEFNQITGSMILPGQRKVLTIPVEESSKNYEPFIESAWKMFLNAHAYCFKKFIVSNDHHHFSVFIMEAFTKSIFEKWNEPIHDRELYSLVLPNFKYLNETMMNIDYCVAATNVISDCPTYITRRKRNSQIANKRRRKRQVWANVIEKERQKASIWGGTAYCLQHMDDPESRLDFGRCSYPQ